jgi:hypothetical protein
MNVNEKITSILHAKSVTEDTNIFDPNNFTEEKNPILSYLFHILLNDDLGNNSDEVQALMNESTAEKKFTDTLTEKQLDLYNETYYNSCSISSKVEAERFICGFKLALILLNEGFKL